MSSIALGIALIRASPGSVVVVLVLSGATRRCMFGSARTGSPAPGTGKPAKVVSETCLESVSLDSQHGVETLCVATALLPDSDLRK